MFVYIQISHAQKNKHVSITSSRLAALPHRNVLSNFSQKFVEYMYIYIYIHICFFLLKIALACDACLLPRSSANLNIQHQERYSWWEVLHMNHRKFFFCRWKQNQYSCGCFPKIGVVVFTPQIKIHLFIGF